MHLKDVKKFTAETKQVKFSEVALNLQIWEMHPCPHTRSRDAACSYVCAACLDPLSTLIHEAVGRNSQNIRILELRGTLSLFADDHDCIDALSFSLPRRPWMNLFVYIDIGYASRSHVQSVKVHLTARYRFSISYY